MRQLIPFIILLSIWSSCDRMKSGSIDPSDIVIATVGQHKLYSSQLEGMFAEGMTSADSAMTTNAFVERWTREQVLLVEAEQNLPDDLDIDGLVTDYRNSLLRLNYEEEILRSRLDSIISDEELLAFYESNKDQYQLEKPILRCLFMQVPAPVPTEREVQKLWYRTSAEDIIQLQDYAAKFSDSYLMNDSTWYTLDQVAELIPSDIVNSKNINSNTDWTLKAKNFKYYLKVLEMKSRKDIAPLSFIQEQASRAVLHRRKLKILAEWRESLYKKALAENKVKIHTN